MIISKGFTLEEGEERIIKKLLKFYKNVIQFVPLPILMIFTTPLRVKGLPIAQGIPPLPQQDELLEGLNHLYKDVNIEKVTQWTNTPTAL